MNDLDFEHAARDKCAIVGIGMTDFTKDSGVSSLRLAAEASKAAISDAGLNVADIDGIVRCDFDTTTTAALASTLGLKNLRFWADTGPGGTAPVMQLSIAIGALLSGQSKAVLIYRALNGRSEARLGAGVRSVKNARVGGQGSFDEFYLPWGLISPGQTFAMVAQEHMRRYGTKQEHLGQLAILCREAANKTPHAQMYNRTLTMDEYLASRPISLPLRLFDFCLETDGAAAAVLTTTVRARDLAQPPALIRGVTGGMPPDMRTGMMFSVTTRDMLEFGATAAGQEIWRRAGIAPQEIDTAQIYDCFTISLLVQLEAFGFCGVGEAGGYIESGALGHDGSLPINTAGGNMSEGYIHGMNHILEAVRQVRGQAANQVEGAKLAFVSSGPLPVGGAAVIRSDT